LIERILLSAVGEEVPRATLRRVSKESGGNPLLALEIARSLTRDGIEIGPGEALPVPSNFAELLPARIADLSPDAERILLFAAATAHPSIELLRAADGDAERADSALRQAETAGVVVLESNRVRFAHPLLASAAYASAVPNVRRETHRRLAEVAEDPEERARHLALATAEPDPQVAAALDEAARRAQSRGAPDAAADLVELARALTPADDTETIAYRTMDAADYHFQAGDVAHARLLTKEALVAAEPGPLRARILHHWSELEWNDVKRCRELSEQALAEADDDDEFQSRLREGHAWVGLIGGDLALAEDEATESLRLAEHTRLPARQASALTALAWAKTLRGTWPTDLWDRAFAMQDSLEGLQAYVMPGLFHAQSLMWADDLDAARRELDVEDGRCIERGQETMRWDVLQSLTYVECRAGNLEMAERHADEAFETVVDAGLDQAMECVLAPRALVRAFRGNVAGARADGIQALEISQRHGDVLWEIYARGALGVLELSLGRFEDAHAHLEPAPELLESMGVREPGFAPYLADEIEALVALGRLDRAEQVTDRLEEQGRVLDRGLALATAARCRGLLAGARGLEAEAMASFEEAMAQHARITYPIELGRTFLALGEVQRRFKIRRQARESLRAAEEILEKVGARLWAQRARAEAARIGGRAVAPDELTETERRIAELVVQGHTNREVAHALFVSVKTVEANLSRAYHKLGITSRRELGSRLHAEGADPHT
jgi:DNA-binding CsgD family transcriptional regulator